jgi:2-keto-4-pentenoate hydratase/2-oxohepta-3-ene-1,7-dioic acid hydratase in catechol pathway
MKLVSYHSPEGLRPGALVDDEVVDISGLAAHEAQPLRSIRELLEAGPQAFAALSQALATAGSRHVVGKAADVRLGPPIADPGKIICVGLNYRAHAAESNREVPTHPTLFAKFANSLVGYKDCVHVPPIEDPQVDFEGELAVVIGRPASRVAAADALNYVAGVSVFNDLTARRLQYVTTQWTNGKAVDDFGPMGPALVTLDELPDVQQLQLRTHVNGREVQSANTSSMIWTVAELISLITATLTLAPGDIIATGTPEGIGARRNPPLFLSDGDVVEVAIEHVGTLQNRIVYP